MQNRVTAEAALTELHETRLPYLSLSRRERRSLAIVFRWLHQARKALVKGLLMGLYGMQRWDVKKKPSGVRAPPLPCNGRHFPEARLTDRLQTGLTLPGALLATRDETVFTLFDTFLNGRCIATSYTRRAIIATRTRSD